ncbi:hypothetical protein ACJX0J_040378, partial [Zea mays]
SLLAKLSLDPNAVVEALDWTGCIVTTGLDGWMDAVTLQMAVHYTVLHYSLMISFTCGAKVGKWLGRFWKISVFMILLSNGPLFKILLLYAHIYSHISIDFQFSKPKCYGLLNFLQDANEFLSCACLHVIYILFYL